MPTLGLNRGMADGVSLQLSLILGRARCMQKSSASGDEGPTYGRQLRGRSGRCRHDVADPKIVTSAIEVHGISADSRQADSRHEGWTLCDSHPAAARDVMRACKLMIRSCSRHGVRTEAVYSYDAVQCTWMIRV